MLDIKVGFSCNNRCLHCVIDPIKKDLQDGHRRLNLTTGQIKQIIDGRSREQVRSLVLTGGEITVRRDFEELVRYAQRQDLELVVQTNARVLADPARCEFLKQMRPILFIVALHASTGEIHDRVTQVCGSFAQTVAAIGNLLAAGHLVAAKMVLSKLNCRDLPACVEFARELGIAKCNVAFPHAPDVRRASFEEVVPRYADLRHEVEQAAGFSEETRFWVDFETIPFCICPTSEAFWRRNCDVLSCARNEGPAAEGGGADKLMNWEVVRPSMKRKHAGCRDCVFDVLCEGPWAEYVERYGDSEFIPVLPTQVAGQLDKMPV